MAGAGAGAADGCDGSPSLSCRAGAPGASVQLTGQADIWCPTVLMTTTWLLLFHYLARHERLPTRHTPAAFFARERQRALLGITAYLLAALLAPWLPLASLLIVAALPVFYGLTSEGSRWPCDRGRAAASP
jgi:hypothetical protein